MSNIAVENHNQVNTSQLRQLIEACVKTQKTLFIEGGPGCGKTAIVRDQLDKMKRTHIYECAAYLSQASFGLPCPDGDYLKMLRNRKWFEHEDATLSFDEADKLSPMLQQLMCQVAHERRLGDDHMKPGCNIILIGNRGKDGNGSYGTSNILTSRTMRVQFQPTADEILSYASKANWHPALLSALMLDKGSTYKHSAGVDRFPCPRSWENASDVLKVVGNDNRELWPAIISGHVGDEATSNMMAILESWQKLIPVADVLRNPTGVAVPEESHIQYLQANVTLSSAKVEDLEQLLVYLTRLNGEVGLDIGVSLLRKYGGSGAKTMGTTASVQAMRKLGIFNYMIEITGGGK